MRSLHSTGRSAAHTLQWMNDVSCGVAIGLRILLVECKDVAVCLSTLLLGIGRSGVCKSLLLALTVQPVGRQALDCYVTLKLAVSVVSSLALPHGPISFDPFTTLGHTCQHTSAEHSTRQGIRCLLCQSPGRDGEPFKGVQ